MPISDRIYAQVALPLQNLSAKGSMLMLRVLGVQISSQASSLELISRSGQVHPLAVAEACSGMRLLMAFMALGVAMAYLDYKPLWQRLTLVAAGIPIAVFCNVVRVSITSWMYYIDKPELGQDFMHYFTGVLMLIPALGLLWLLSWILRKMVVEVDEEPAPEGQEKAQA
jgi:exosortase